MENKESRYRSLLSIKDLQKIPDDKALEKIGLLIDYSGDLEREDGIQRALELSDILLERNLNKNHRIELEYFLGNAWNILERIRRGVGKKEFSWEADEVEKSLIHFRRALHLFRTSQAKLSSDRVNEIHTNLGNHLTYVGRYISGIEFHDMVLQGNPKFGMAHGGKGCLLFYYGCALYDETWKHYMFHEAAANLKTALSLLLEGDAPRATFKKMLEQIPEELRKGKVKYNNDLNKLGKTIKEKQYKQWCLLERLFLNPLNDLGPYVEGAGDTLHLPSMVTNITKGPWYYSFYNQLKQEFVSARYLYYESISANHPHFSDKGVTLFDTLDYPAYSLHVEKIKLVYRTIYSLFDKIAYFINSYFKLPIKKKHVYFQTLWYKQQSKKNKKQNRNKELREEFRSRKNWSLRGLFWISKDFYENKQGFQETLEPTAREIYSIRNHLEHKYLKVHEYGPPGRKSLPWGTDDIAFSINRRNLCDKTLYLLKTAREALIYLSLAVYDEETKRRQVKHTKTMPSPLFFIDDKGKI